MQVGGYCPGCGGGVALGREDQGLAQGCAGDELTLLLGGCRVVERLERVAGPLGGVACGRAVRGVACVANQPFGREADAVTAGDLDPDVEVLAIFIPSGKPPTSWSTRRGMQTAEGMAI